jgi:hypothetical protein
VERSLYKVDTRAVSVEVSFGDRARVSGEMFLRPSIVTLSGVESIADRLNDRDAFFPLRVAGSAAAMTIVGKSQVRYLSAALEPVPEFASLPEASDALSFHVDVELDDGERLTGVFQAVLPRGKRRALDFINGHEGLFVSFVVEQREFVINRAFIRCISDGTK